MSEWAIGIMLGLFLILWGAWLIWGLLRQRDAQLPVAPVVYCVQRITVNGIVIVETRLYS